MINISVKIDGLDRIKKLLKNAPAVTAREVSRAVEKSVITLESEAKKQAPVNKSYGGGNLRQNIRSRMISRFRGEIRSDAPYSLYVHEGTRPHVIRPVRKRGLANRRTNQYFGQIVHHPGTRANPFMERAVDKVKGKINGFFQEALTRITKSLV